jgi:hypothetical protein
MALWVLIEAHSAALTRSNDSHRLWETLRCGKKVLGTDTTSITNDYGNMDLSKVGCSYTSFFARADEIETALQQSDPSKSEYNLFFWSGIRSSFVGVVATFVLANVAGFLALLFMSIGNWVWAGFKG